MKISYEEHLKSRLKMPTFDESIFYPEVERRKLGITDEDMKQLVEFFRWQLEQRNRRRNRRRVITMLKLRMEKLIHQKKIELLHEIKAFQSSQPAGIEKFESD